MDLVFQQLTGNAEIQNPRYARLVSSWFKADSVNQQKLSADYTLCMFHRDINRSQIGCHSWRPVWTL